MKRMPEILILIALLVLVAVNGGRLFGRRLKAAGADAPQEALQEKPAIPLEQARGIFPDATAAVPVRDGLFEVKAGGRRLGFLMPSSPQSDSVGGFMGTTPLLIGLGVDGRIVGVLALPNEETPHFFERVRKSGLLNAWNGLTPAEAAAKKVDAVSGATFSSKSVIESLQVRLAAAGEIPVKRTDWAGILADVALLLLASASAAAFFRPKSVAAYRRWIPAASVVLLGVWQGRYLSLSQWLVWLVNGVPLGAQWAMLLVFAVSVLLPMVFGRAYYCTWLCPLGACQGLLGELNRKHKLTPGKTVSAALRMLRKAILFGGLLLMVLGFSFDFSRYEAFAVFRPQSAPLAALILGIASLLLSVWVTRPWCRFLCPLGEMLEIVRRRKEGTRGNNTEPPQE